MRYPQLMRPVLTVFFDGSCPMCVREVAAYRRQAPSDILWNNLALPGLQIPVDRRGYQPDPAVLMKRFHVFSSDGLWLHGAPAFVLLWRRLGWMWRALASIGRLPGGVWLMDTVYAGFLRLRPFLQRTVRSVVSEPSVIPQVMIPAIRSDHAGETGAVWIYRAMLLWSRDQQLRPLLKEHAEQEQQHLTAFNELLPWRFRSRLLPAWRLAGWLVGTVAAAGGRRWILATIAAVERFVDRHYQEQIDHLERLVASDPGADAMQDGSLACSSGMCGNTPLSPHHLLGVLNRFRSDECRHRDEAQQLLAEPIDSRAQTGNRLADRSWSSRLLERWCGLVGWGSAVAVRAAKII
ncbi:MAG: DUF393 domain-containing protein [Betaproteobacteria bacterium]|nr:DUF393 domain-containing protein [Betaproteobacteria bacterium]